MNAWSDVFWSGKTHLHPCFLQGLLDMRCDASETMQEGKMNQSLYVSLILLVLFAQTILGKFLISFVDCRKPGVAGGRRWKRFRGFWRRRRRYLKIDIIFGSYYIQINPAILNIYWTNIDLWKLMEIITKNIKKTR